MLVVMATGKPRILQDGRDMIWTVLALLGVCIFVLFASGNWTFGLKAGNGDDKVPAFDVSAALVADARSMPFPLRRPATPDGWKPNSGSTQMVGGSVASNVGWVSKKGSYVQLTQTSAPEDELVAFLGGFDAMGAGKRDAGGHSWVVYDGEDKNKFWITDLGDVRIGVRSKGLDADIEKIAVGVVTQEPLPKPAG